MFETLDDDTLWIEPFCTCTGVVAGIRYDSEGKPEYGAVSVCRVIFPPVLNQPTLFVIHETPPSHDSVWRMRDHVVTCVIRNAKMHYLQTAKGSLSFIVCMDSMTEIKDKPKPLVE